MVTRRGPLSAVHKTSVHCEATRKLLVPLRDAASPRTVGRAPAGHSPSPRPRRCPGSRRPQDPCPARGRRPASAASAAPRAQLVSAARRRHVPKPPRCEPPGLRVPGPCSRGAHAGPARRRDAAPRAPVPAAASPRRCPHAPRARRRGSGAGSVRARAEPPPGQERPAGGACRRRGR